ncbi:uncharacterized protein C8Q71DRAFT_858500 [Rhodofomes roseus]|uniref:Uncharacterized protein n=1 Tax=Rhodofomes roseus TaxID=34475 RepID=A0ABQ8KE14_9APHY|nr:uncharacterized protein C8Q71DRAFT_858500 [Rhodofomes roseus]KAH9835641.1 hypothetical protein C8Q71DRAFT_858500 [Rhodofomes roseus]
MPNPGRPGTRAKNKNQHPGDVVKENSVIRRTKKELEAARKLDSEKKKAAELVRTGKIRSLADVQSRLRQRDDFEQSGPPSVLPPKLRRQVPSTSSASASAEARGLSHLDILEPGEADGVSSDDEAIEYDAMQSYSERLPDIAAILSEAPHATTPASKSRRPQVVLKMPSTEHAAPKKSRKKETSMRRGDIEAVSSREDPALAAASDTRSVSPALPEWATAMMATQVTGKRKAGNEIIVDGSPATAQPSKKAKASGSGSQPALPFGLLASWKTPPTRTQQSPKTPRNTHGKAPTPSKSKTSQPASAPKTKTAAPVVSRRTAQGMVAVTSTPTPVQGAVGESDDDGSDSTGHGPAVRATNEALPDGTRSKYNAVFMPRLLELLGRLDNPWDLQRINPAAEMQRLWEELFPNHPLGYVMQPKTPVYVLTMQRVYNWRSDLGEAAINAVKKYWEDNQLFGTDERTACAAFHIGDSDPYLYGHVKTVKRGDKLVIEKHYQRFQHAIVMETLAEHLWIISKIPSHGNPCGALLLACAAAERAWTLGVRGEFPVKHRKKHSRRTSEPAMPSFSEKNAGARAMFYVRSIKRLDASAWDAILERSCALIRERSASGQRNAHDLDEADVDDSDAMYSDSESGSDTADHHPQTDPTASDDEQNQPPAVESDSLSQRDDDDASD